MFDMVPAKSDTVFSFPFPPPLLFFSQFPSKVMASGAARQLRRILTLYSKSECMLCDEAKLVVNKVTKEVLFSSLSLFSRSVASAFDSHCSSLSMYRR